MFGKWRPFPTWAAALLFGFSSALADRLPDAYGNQWGTLFQALPYVLTLIAVAGVIGRSIGPAAAAGRMRSSSSAQPAPPRLLGVLALLAIPVGVAASQRSRAYAARVALRRRSGRVRPGLARSCSRRARERHAASSPAAAARRERRPILGLVGPLVGVTRALALGFYGLLVCAQSSAAPAATLRRPCSRSGTA